MTFTWNWKNSQIKSQGLHFQKISFLLGVVLDDLFFGTRTENNIAFH